MKNALQQVTWAISYALTFKNDLISIMNFWRAEVQLWKQNPATWHP